MVLRATDSAGATDTQSFTIKVRTAPTFTSTPVLTGIVNSVYSYDVTTTDADGPGSFVISLNSAPSWLNVVDNGDGTAKLIGVPDYFGNYMVTLKGQIRMVW